MKKRLITITVLMLAALSTFAQFCKVKSAGGEIECASLGDAVTAVNSSSAGDVPVLTVLDDASALGAQTITHDVIIDLNGHTLTFNKLRMLTVEGAKVTVKDGSAHLISKAGTRTIYGIYLSHAQLTIDGASISAQNTSDSSADASTYGVYMEDGTASAMTMTSGDISARSKGINVYAVYSNDAHTIDISGGSLSAEGYQKTFGIYNNRGTVNIGGAVSVSVRAKMFAYALSQTNIGMMTVDGGTYVTYNSDGTYSDLQQFSKASQMKILNGAFSHSGYLDRYIGTRKLDVVPVASELYARGCRVVVADKTSVLPVATNLTSGSSYATLEDALADAQEGETVSLTGDYTLTHDATVRKGVTLLVPFNMGNDVIRDCGWSFYTINNIPQTKLFRQLTVGEGVRLTIDGELSVGAIQRSVYGGNVNVSGSVFGDYGLVTLQEGAEVIDNGNVYCWGYIAGKGTMTVMPGAKLYESLQISDWKGGNRSYNMFVKHVYPFNNYFVQNVEVPLTIKAGAQLVTGTDIGAEGESHRGDGILFIANSPDALYNVSDGTEVVRRYHAAEDRIEYVFRGDVAMEGLTLEVDGIGIESYSCRLPLPFNQTLRMEQGTLTMAHDYILCPGAEILLGDEGHLNIGDSIYVFKRSGWDVYSDKGYVHPLDFTIANGTNNRLINWSTMKKGDDEISFSRLRDARIDIYSATLPLSSTAAQTNEECLAKGSGSYSGYSLSSSSGLSSHLSFFGSGALFTSDSNGGTPSYIGQLYRLEMEPRDVPVYNALDMNGDNRVSMHDANIAVNNNQLDWGKVIMKRYLSPTP